MGELQDKNCIVTGGAGSIGLASTALFLKEGARVLLVDHDMHKLESARNTARRVWFSRRDDCV